MVHSPGVGHNLQDHLMVGINFDVSPGQGLDPLEMFYPSSWLSLLRGEGPLTSTGAGVLAHVRTPVAHPQDPRPDIQLHFTAFTMATDRGQVLKKNFGFKDVDPIDEWISKHFGLDTGGILPTLVRPKSRGSIKLRSSDPFDHPIIEPNYLSDQGDVDTLVAGLELAHQLVQTEALRGAGAQLWEPDPLCGHTAFLTDTYWECYVRHYALTVYHPVGTAAMGSVLDSQLRVVGVRGLRVADASVMPRIVGGNTNAPTIMIGEKAADFIIQDALD